MQELFAYAVSIHRELEESITKDILNLPLESDAAALHEFFFSCVPATVFQAYVKHVHNELERPNWLAGRPGVSWEA